MRIGMILDNPRRDLSGITLVSYELAKQGCEVYVIPMYEQIHDVGHLDLDAIVVNYARINNIDQLCAYKAAGITVFVLDTEGGIHPDKGIVSPEFLAKRSREVGAYRYVDHYLFWGPRMLSAFKEYSGFLESQLHLTGCPRYDICHEKWRGMLAYGQADYVLFNFNFPSLNPWWSNADYNRGEESIVFHGAEKEMRNGLRIVNVEAEKALPIEQKRKEAFTRLIRVILDVARRNPNRLFVVRPHPFENQQIYKDIFAGTENVTVDNSGEVAHVINRALFVAHLNCGSSADARMLGKVPVSIEFLNSEELRLNITTPSRVSCSVNTVDELDRIIKDPKILDAQPFSEGDYRQYLHPWFFERDGKASERVAHVIMAETKVRRNIAGPVQRFRLMRVLYGREHAKSVLIGLIAQVLGTYWWARARIILHSQREMKYASARKIQEMLEKINLHDRGDSSFAVDHAKNALTGARLMTIRVVRTQMV